MIRYLIFWLIKRFYVNNLDEIVKISPIEEKQGFRFTDAESTLKLLKSMLTAQTLRYYEASTEFERNMVKGGATMLKVLIDCHGMAAEIESLTESDEVKQKKWILFRNKNRTN